VFQFQPGYSLTKDKSELKSRDDEIITGYKQIDPDNYSGHTPLSDYGLSKAKQHILLK